MSVYTEMKCDKCKCYLEENEGFFTGYGAELPIQIKVEDFMVDNQLDGICDRCFAEIKNTILRTILKQLD